MRKKALLAVLLASVVLNSPQASLAVENESTVSLKTKIETFSESNEVPPERRCYQLVSFAFQILRGQESSIASGYWLNPKKLNRGSFFVEGSNELNSWARDMSVSARSRVLFSRTVLPAQLEAAGLALEEADKLAKRSELNFALPLSMAVTVVFKLVGNEEAVQSCSRLTEELLQRVEREKASSADEIRAAAAVLNSKADSVTGVSSILLSATDFHKSSETEYQRSRSLRLRAAALLDRLPTTDHERRLAHRNLAMMYMAQGELELAEKEKLILFELVGIADDSILNPQGAGCGHVIWWRSTRVSTGFACGMG
ncbi:hypothetical protein KF728_20945 [Candidatus Obscuribacterales bacterium]|nr:hypothetical protein [Candidatus Obscuribacterales bacterium]MBX3152637.1 hypothetical protein [Candidatus Obscuribacterales bacterium]